MLARGITLRALELIEALARHGTLAVAARHCGLSLPAASQQLANLEATLGVTLFDRAHRPFRLTPAGRGFLGHGAEALRHLRQAEAELAVFDVGHLKSLRLGVIDDFDTEITPRLVIALAQSLHNCTFRLTTGPSHDLVRMLAEGGLDMALAAAGPAASPAIGAGIVEHPLLRDPYLMAAPRSLALPKGRELAALAGLPLLRYDRGQLMGRQIEAHLARHRIALPDRFEIDSNQSIMALVASGSGWSVTTALACLRARALLDQVAMHPLPMAAMARTISLFVREGPAAGVAAEIARSLRAMMAARLVGPAGRLMPWLGEDFAVITGD